MKDKQGWDWSTDLKEIPVKEWDSRFNWAQAPQVSPDGERIAAVVNKDEMAFTVCVNQDAWDAEYEKVWRLMPLPDNRFAALVASDEQWTVNVDGQEWSNWFDFIWNLSVCPDGTGVGAAFQTDMEYGVVVDDVPWENCYENMTGMVLGAGKNSAAVVQVAPMAAADVNAFKAGLFSVALNGKAPDQRFLNAWDLSFDGQGRHLAFGVRLDRETYGIVQDDRLWETRCQSVWKPEFMDADTLVAPVRISGKWHLYKNDAPFWQGAYHQLWKPLVSPAGKDVAAVVSPQFGKWTVALNDKPWDAAWDTMISDILFSENGQCLAAVLKHRETWDLAVDGNAWHLEAQTVFPPVFTPDGSIAAVVVQRKNQYQLVVNGHPLVNGYEFMAEPVISPDNQSVLVKGIENGIYKRRILSL